MIKFHTIVSGSSGNATVLSDGKTTILIDCGLSGKQLAASLCDLEISPDDISCILVTHEHIDHTKGVGIIARRHNIPVAASSGTWSNMNIGNIDDSNIISFDDFKPFEIEGIGVTPFPIPHDAAMPTGFRFDLGNTSFAVATDMGHITKEVKTALKGCEHIVLEANYDHNMLINGAYPYYLKKRIGGSFGHLCNDDTGEMAEFLINNNTKSIVLGHLSAENNSPERAFETVARHLDLSGIKIGNDVIMSVAPRYTASKNIFGE